MFSLEYCKIFDTYYMTRRYLCTAASEYRNAHFRLYVCKKLEILLKTHPVSFGELL